MNKYQDFTSCPDLIIKRNYFTLIEYIKNKRVQNIYKEIKINMNYLKTFVNTMQFLLSMVYKKKQFFMIYISYIVLWVHKKKKLFEYK